jgi:hypothetical protein
MRFVSQNLHHCIIGKLYSHTMKHCEILITKNDIMLPHAVNLEQGDWLIVSNHSQVILCKSNSRQVQVPAPIGHLNLPLGCAAQSQWLRLPTTYYQYSTDNLLPDLQLFRSNLSILDFVPIEVKQTMLDLPDKIVPLLDNGQPLDRLRARISDYLVKSRAPLINRKHTILMSTVVPIGIVIIVLVIIMVLVKCKVIRLVTTRQLASQPDSSDDSPAPVVLSSPPVTSTPTSGYSSAQWLPTT